MAGKQERQRKLARERHERRMAREAARQQRTRQMTKYASGGVVLLALIGIVTFAAAEGGAAIATDSSYGALEAVKAVSQLFCPVAGEVVEPWAAKMYLLATGSDLQRALGAEARRNSEAYRASRVAATLEALYAGGGG